MLDATHRSLN
jgi:hypothetical protein